MVEVGIRELKTHLSDYIKQMERGEIIAVKVHRQVVGYLSTQKPVSPQEKSSRSLSRTRLQKKLGEWKKAGIILSGSLNKLEHFKPIPLKGNKTSTQILREIRDEE